MDKSSALSYQDSDLPWLPSVEEYAQQYSAEANFRPLGSHGFGRTRTTIQPSHSSHRIAFEDSGLVRESTFTKLSSASGSSEATRYSYIDADDRPAYVRKNTFVKPSSTEEPVETLIQELSGTFSPSSPVKSSESGYRSNTRPQFDRADTFVKDQSAVPHDSRAPRYGATFTSYEEILENMMESDPFNNPYPLAPLRRSSRSNEEGSPSRRLYRQRTEEAGDEDEYEEKSQGRSRKNKKKKRRVKTTDDSEHALNDTYTFDNPAYARRESTQSRDTYTVDDDHDKLVHSPSSVAMQSTMPDSMMTSRSQDVKTFKVDSRETQCRTKNMATSDVSAFVKQNFKQRTCRKYIKDPKKEDAICCCGRDAFWHRDEANLEINEKTKEKWMQEKHTVQEMANSYGVLTFQGFGQEATKIAPYIRCEPDTDLEILFKLLSECWQMPPPKLIISVTGGAKRFFMKSRLMAAIKRGLINAATSTGAWIVTGGTNTGVMGFVGEAIRDHMLSGGSSQQKVVALGIATWGCIDNRESLVGETNEGLFPAVYNNVDLSPAGAKGIAPLDHNHTHFILVDDGTELKFGKEIKLRVELEQYVSQKMETSVSKTKSVHTPVVLLVLEGGENTMATAMESIKLSTPVVAIQGSGRAADYIAFGYKLTKSRDEEKSTFPPNFDEECIAQARKSFDWSREKDPKMLEKKLKGCVKNLRTILEHRNLVNIYNMDEVDTAKEIDQAILYALLKANRSDAQSQLNLALAWNRCDIAREEIFKAENRSQWQKMNLEEAMFTALVQNKVDFVQLLIDSGVDLKTFLTCRRLRDLYDDVVQDTYAGPGVELFNHLLLDAQQTFALNCCRSEQIKDDLPNLLHLVGTVLMELMGDQSTNVYSGQHFVVKEADETDDGGYSPKKRMSHRKTRMRMAGKPDFENPERELLYWAVLLNRSDLAEMFWRTGRDHIGGALTASALFKSLSQEADKEEEIDLSQDLMKSAVLFEEYAVGTLNCCYQKDKIMAHRLVVRELPEWGYTTAMALANSAEQMDFMGHPACQTKLNSIWLGKMALYTPMWKILLSLVFPLMIPAIRFSTHEMVLEKTQEDTPEAESNQNGDLRRSKENIMESSASDINKVSPEGHPSGNKRERSVRSRKLYKVGITSGDGSKQTINLCAAIFYYYTAPLTKFIYHTISQIIYLGLFSFFLLTDLHPDAPHVPEMIIWGWSLTLLMEELRQMITRDSKSVKFKLSGYFSSVWNQFDLLVYFLLLISIVLRFTLVTEEEFIWARMMYSITLALHFIRFMHIFYVEKNLGPKVIMIRRMLTDLMFFIAIFVVFILAYGVASAALRFPNAPLTWNVLKDVVYIPYWQMYGELFLEDLEGDVPGCSSNRTIWENDPEVPRCPEQSWLVIVLFAIYMVLINILLLNLLIAMFSYTFERVQENSEKVWRFYRYDIFFEYFDRPTFAPPLIIFSHILRLIKHLSRKCRNIDKLSNDFRTILSKEEHSKLTAFERSAHEEYLIIQQQDAADQIGSKVTHTNVKVDSVITDLETIKEQVIVPETAAETAAAPIADPRSANDMTVIQNRIASVEDRMQAHTEQLQDIYILLQQIARSGGGGGGSRPPRGTRVEIQDYGESMS